MTHPYWPYVRANNGKNPLTHPLLTFCTGQNPMESPYWLSVLGSNGTFLLIHPYWPYVLGKTHWKVPNDSVGAPHRPWHEARDPDMIRYIDEFGQTTTRMQWKKCFICEICDAIALFVTIISCNKQVNNNNCIHFMFQVQGEVWEVF